MWKKIKAIFKPDWHAIIQSVYGNLIYYLLGGLVLSVSGLWYFLSTVDPLSFRIRMSQAIVISLYFLTALGAGVIFYIPWKMWSGKRSPILMKFSMNLDKETKNQHITGIGINFLRRIKSAPPFLGVNNAKPEISIVDEQTLTEFFHARIYMENHKDAIYGGHYQIKSGDTRKKIAKRFYGDEKYQEFVESRFDYPTGTYISMQYVNTNTSDLPDFIIKQIGLSQNEGEIVNLLRRYNLVEDEAIRLVRLVFDAAQKTLNERKR